MRLAILTRPLPLRRNKEKLERGNSLPLQLPEIITLPLLTS